MSKIRFRLPLLLLLLSVAASMYAEKVTPQTSGSFQWLLVEDYGCCAAKLPDGTVLIPIDEEYTNIKYVEVQIPNDSANSTTCWFLVDRGEKRGIHTVDGQLLIPVQYNQGEIFYNFQRGFYIKKNGEETNLEIKLYPGGIAYGEGLPRGYRQADVPTAANSTPLATQPETPPAIRQQRSNVRRAPQTEILSNPYGK